MSYSKITNLALALIYYFFLSFIYSTYIVDVYGSEGYRLDYAFYKVILSVLSLMGFYLLLLKRTNNLSTIFHHVMMVTMFIPSLVIYSMGQAVEVFLIVNVLACAIVIVTSRVISFNIKKFPHINEKRVLYVLSIFVTVYLLGIVAQGGLQYLNFDLSKVYDIRSSASANLWGGYAYLSPIVGKIVTPILIVIAVLKKKWFFVLFAIISSVLIFGLTAHKAPFIYPFLVLLVYYLADKNFPKLFLLIFIGICLLSYIDITFYAGTNSSFGGWFTSLLINRSILVPSFLNNYFIEFFSENSVYFWSGSKITFGLLEMPYELPSPHLIGKEYFGNDKMSANTGWIGSGFAQAGWIGMVLYSFFVGCLLSLFESIGKKIGRSFVISVSFILILVIFTSTDFVTSFLTHGLIFLILLLLVLPKNLVKV